MRLIAAGIVLAVLSSHSLAQIEPWGSAIPDEPAKASLISLEDGLVPGEVLHLAIRYQMAPHWHIYWNGLNDSGLAPAITLDLPEGYEALATQWPAPRRSILGENDILDHVLEGEVLAIIPIRVPRDAKLGGVVRFSGKSDWLVCDEACIPGQASFSLELALVSRASATKHSGAFERARRRTPIALAGDGERLGIKLSWEGQSLVVASDSPGRIEFYPHATSTPMLERFTDPVGDDGTLRLRLESDGAVRGVLRLSREKGDSRPGLVAIDLGVGVTVNPQPSPAIGWRPWLPSLDGMKPWRASGGTTGVERLDGRDE